MSTEVLQLHLNLAAMSAKYLRDLQHQHDVIKLLEAGATSVTAESIANQRDFASFTPANGAQLEHEAARSAAKDWLLKGFLRDAVEATGLFLDECLQACAVIVTVGHGGPTKADVLNQLFNVLPRKNHRLHLPEKLNKLLTEYGVKADLNLQVLSLNKARTCVVHRLGQVTHLDVDESGELLILFRTFEMVAKEKESGDEMLLDRPGLLIKAESVVNMRIVDKTRVFKVGEQIRLDPSELYATIVTLWQFGAQLTKSVEELGRQRGLAFDAPATGA